MAGATEKTEMGLGSARDLYWNGAEPEERCAALDGLKGYARPEEDTVVPVAVPWRLKH